MAAKNDVVRAERSGGCSFFCGTQEEREQRKGEDGGTKNNRRDKTNHTSEKTKINSMQWWHIDTRGVKEESREVLHGKACSSLSL